MFIPMSFPKISANLEEFCNCHCFMSEHSPNLSKSIIFAIYVTEGIVISYIVLPLVMYTHIYIQIDNYRYCAYYMSNILSSMLGKHEVLFPCWQPSRNL